MDLYGDLPPAQGEAETAVSRGKESSSDPAAAPSFSTSKQFPQPINQKEYTVKTKSTSFGTAGIVPQVAPFKPRQANKVVAPQKKTTSSNTVSQITVSQQVTVHTNQQPSRGSSEEQCGAGIMSYDVIGTPYDPARPNDYLEW
jgi:hypothetical protein